MNSEQALAVYVLSADESEKGISTIRALLALSRGGE